MLSFVWLFQVYTAKQLAIGAVYPYPGAHKALKILEALGKAHNEPSVQQLMEATALSDAKHSANWRHVVSYTRTITPQNVHQHIPFTSYLMCQC